MEVTGILPSFTLYNMRSIFLKKNSLVNDLKERKTPLSFLTEIWEKKENKEHQEAIEHMCQMNGLSYISLPRPGRKRGGGCAVLYRSEAFSVTKLSIEVPKPLQALWTIL